VSESIPTLDEVIEIIEVIDEANREEKIAEQAEEKFEIEEPCFSTPTFLSTKAIEWKLTDYRQHAFILGREYRPEWAAAAMYLASWLTRKNCKAKVVVPVKWMRTYVPSWFDKKLIAYDTQVTDLIDDDFSFWHWGLEGKTHWLPREVQRELRSDKVRLQVVDAKDKNRWISDQVFRLKSDNGGITAFVFWICLYQGNHEYLKMALRESEDSSWMTHPDFLINSNK
jgi:hypothetical protein